MAETAIRVENLGKRYHIGRTQDRPARCADRDHAANYTNFASCLLVFAKFA